MNLELANTQSKKSADWSSALANWARRHDALLVTLGSLMAIVLLLWVPTGWNVSEVSDDWVFFNQFELGLSPIDFGGARVFTSIAEWLQYALTPDSWVGANLVLAGLLILKGLAVYLLIRELLPDQPVIAYSVSLLYTVFFADLGVFWLVAVNVHAATLFAILAAWLLLRQYRNPHPANLILMGICQALALGYEGVYGVVFLAPLLLLFPARGITRRVLKLSALYLVVPGLILVRYVFLISSGTGLGYQSGEASIALQGDVPRAFANSLWRIYKRVLGLVWYENKADIIAYPSYWMLAIISGCITLGGGG